MHKYSIYPIYSKRDKFGNCYWAFRALNLENGNMTEATISGTEGNIKCSTLYFTKEETYEAANKVIIMQEAKEMPIRAFDKFVKPLEYAGDTPQKIASFILSKIG